MSPLTSLLLNTSEIRTKSHTVSPKHLTFLVQFEGPIPGYTGHARRVAADNIYGATFANARKKAELSMNRINHER